MELIQQIIVVAGLVGAVFFGWIKPGTQKMSFEITPRTPTFAHDVVWEVKRIPPDVRYVCFGYQRLRDDSPFDPVPGAMAMCQIRRKSDAQWQRRLGSGLYDVFVQTYDNHNAELDYRIKQIEVK